MFTVISAVTTTGLITISSLTIILGFTILLHMFLMLIGRQAGSTASAIKQDHILVALASSYWYIRDKISHKRTIRTNFTLKHQNYE
ncbi:MAG TPA: hypothetical protein GX698_01515 [Acholeplasmataceae bacterium]|nr:hypothetical protein [Acholeplasmataceae bacterium]